MGPQVAMAVLASLVLAEAMKAHEAVVGNMRVQALSASLVRIEPKGPMGFEDRTTFMVSEERSNFTGLPIAQQESPRGTLLITEYYSVLLRARLLPAPTCSNPRNWTDTINGVPAQNYPQGLHVASRADCCAACDNEPTCLAWTFDADPNAGTNCWPWQGWDYLWPYVNNKEFGCASRGNPFGDGICSPGQPFSILSPTGDVLYDSASDQNRKPTMLHWPAPLSSKSYALVDFPRFYAPPWGASPVPNGTTVDPELAATNGYDFRNNVAGDTYVFLLGKTLDSWQAARSDFIKLSGPVPLLPDFAYGTWYTEWMQWSEDDAKANITRWATGKLPIDVWGLDMNWRLTDNNKDRFYNYPNTKLFPDFEELFTWQKDRGLRCFFNDHPFPVASRNAGGLQTSPEEVAFRWEGLTQWLGRGLAYWWFDLPWQISIPAPMVNSSGDGGPMIWDGLDNAAWAAHVYYTITEQFNRRVKNKEGDKWYGGRPLTLTPFSPLYPVVDPMTPSLQYAEHPAHHRYPVWWTGDAVPLHTSIRTMVDSGMHDFKPYVDTNCGGVGWGFPGDWLASAPTSAGDSIRWASHCAFGTILRFAGGEHQPWMHGAHVEDTVRLYLQARYRLMPTILGAGTKATRTAFPLVARGDFYWPEHAPSSADSNQYVFLDDLLVAPIWDSNQNETTRSVWIPPGEWQDAWDGSILTGPKTVLTTQPYERMPLWYRRDGGILAMTDKDALTVETQDWSTLVLELFPSSSAVETSRLITERGTEVTQVTTDVLLRSAGQGQVVLEIKPQPAAPKRAWVLRFNLHPEQLISSLEVDGQPLPVSNFRLLQPVSSDAGYFPFGGTHAQPAAGAGVVAELQLGASQGPRVVSVVLAKARSEHQFATVYT